MEDVPLFEPDEEDQPAAPQPVPEHRVETLARVLAGFRWPERETFERLKKGQQRACRDAARAALESLAVALD